MFLKLRPAFFALLFATFAMMPFGVLGQSSDVQTQINDRNQKIADLQKEIGQLQSQLDETSQQKQTLQNAINSLDLSRKKLTAQITLTQTQISRADLQIQTLSGSIATTTSKISDNTLQIGEILRDLELQDREPVAALLLTEETLSSFFTEYNSLGTVREALTEHIRDLSDLKNNLQTNKTTAEGKRQELASLKATLAGQQQALTATIASKNQLLAQTKDQESSYQKLIAQKEAQEQQFEQELEDFQNQLGTTVDTSSLPHPGSGILSWPFSNDFMSSCSKRASALKNNYCITQYFGNTTFATQNPQVYNGHGHNAIDIAAPLGTPVESARAGTVLGTGNTDLTCAGASYGKWVLIKHDNGLSTLYAHLSSINVSKGDALSQGQVLGYSGMTGYATGPHLHFSVFASDVVQITSFPSQGCKGKTYTMPVAPLEGYLNPLSYL